MTPFLDCKIDTLANFMTQRINSGTSFQTFNFTNNPLFTNYFDYTSLPTKDFSSNISTFSIPNFEDFRKKLCDIVYANWYSKSNENPSSVFPSRNYYEYNTDAFISTIDKSKSVTKHAGGPATVKENEFAIQDISQDFQQKYRVKEQTLADGSKIFTCGYTKVNGLQPEFIDALKYYNQAAKELGYTVVYSDLCRSVSESNAARSKKGDMVCRGGESPHNYGTAADIVLFKNGKQCQYGGKDYALIVKRANELSGGKIEWGGDFKGTATVNGKQVARSSVEGHHIQLANWKEFKTSEYLIA